MKTKIRFTDAQLNRQFELEKKVKSLQSEVNLLNDEVSILKNRLEKLEVPKQEMFKGSQVVMLRYNSRRELFKRYGLLKNYSNQPVSVDKYPDSVENNIHYFGIKVGDTTDKEINDAYEFISGVYTNHKSNEYKSYLFMTFKDYQKLKYMYKFTWGRNKDKKVFNQYLIEKVK